MATRVQISVIKEPQLKGISYHNETATVPISYKVPSKAVTNRNDYDVAIGKLNNLSSNRLASLGEVPSLYSILVAKTITGVLSDKGIYNAKVSPSPDGGVMLELIIEGEYYLIEIYNDGDLVFLVRSVDGKREAYDFDLKSLIEEILERFGK